MDSTTSVVERKAVWNYVWYCHGLPERSLLWHGKHLPICARCTGLWIGYGVGAVLAWWIILPWWVGALLVAPLVFDGGTQALGWRRSNNHLRLITGKLAGIGEVMLLIWLLTGCFLLGRSAGLALIN